MVPNIYRIGGDKIAVYASIHTLGGFSAHASQSQLIDWISNFNKPHPKLFLIHGEEEAKLVLQQKLVEQGWSANIPGSGESISF